MTTLGSRIKMVRGKESQEKFAARLEISKGTLGFYERDENLPKSDVILKICALTGASLDWLLTGAESATRETAHDLAPCPTPARQAKQSAAAPQESRECSCPQCAELKKRLTTLEEERRDLYAENRNLWKKLCSLLEESARPRERPPLPLYDGESKSRRRRTFLVP
ncbi:helix-turn-helix transcriptional regulator [Desulfovibrio sp. ZJ369]|uniref:helix-turn-helix domain-containing protein n=1 Tax=Desulfovibrio sp. ZJ369 TaxID=2709793 RepID=UPI0013ECB43E|nr:helix-turn-helix transcriptional regulator [Desulfovibrio sp. ZJ369]